MRMLMSGVPFCGNVKPVHKTEYTLDLDSLTDLEEFVAKISEIKGDVNAKYGVREVDAKSFLGMSSISQYPILVTLLSEDKTDIDLFESVCKKYEIRK